MKKSTFTVISKACLTVFALLMALLITATGILMENESVITNALGASSTIIYTDEDADSGNNIYYDTVYGSVAEERANSEALVQEVVREGAVLLKNENEALPLSKNDKINLYGITSYNYVVSGGGSSSTGASSWDLKTQFESASVGLDVNDELYNWYAAHYYDGGVSGGYYGRRAISGLGCGVGNVTTIGEIPWANLPTAKNTRAKAGVFFIGRVGCEDVDNFMNINDPSQTGNATYNAGNDMTDGDYLTLSPAEINVLQNMKTLKDNGTIDKIIVILNTTNQVEAKFLEDDSYGIDSALWIASVGSTGIKGVADVLVGNVSPSGRLSDTFWAEHMYNPVLANFGNYTYAGTLANGGSPETLAIYDYGTRWRAGYVMYQEGIYNGYRYTETRYEDTVLEREKVGQYDYKEVVSYPFGYGLSYTTFGYSDFTVVHDASKDTYTASVKVENTGTVAGKEVVQIYLQKPYTQYDKANKVEKPAVELVGFGKTKVLAAGETQIVEVEIAGEQLTSYDSNGAKGYILESGDYYFTAGRDSHDAVNNILKSKGADESKIIAIGNCGKGNANLVYKKTISASGANGVDATTYRYSTEAMEAGRKNEPVEVTNKFDYADITKYEHKNPNDNLYYITRSDWAGTVKYGLDEHNNVLSNYATITLTAGMESDVKEEKFFAEKAETDTVAYPTMGSTKTNYTLMDLRAYDDGDSDPTNDVPIPYNDPLWDDLLDQLTWDDMVKLLSDGQRKTGAISSISKPETIDHNGAVGVNQAYNNTSNVNRGFAMTMDDPNKASYPTAKPSNGLAAATFNAELMLRYGEAWGEDALWAGYSGLYGPGINMHRSPYAGRVFEYYSEDPVLTGKLNAQLCKGIEGKGIYVYNKHGILNEQEEGRRTISTWANEQSIREIYLRPFEISIEEGGARNIMTGLNKIGPFTTIVSGFCNDLLRDEFGMEGFVVTDYHHDAQSQIIPVAHLYGTDLPDRTYQTRGGYDGLEKDHGRIAWGMRTACHNILYTTVHSAMINGLSTSTRIISITPDWIYWLGIARTASIILTAASAVMLLSCYAFPYLTDLGKKAATNVKEKKSVKGLIQKPTKEAVAQYMDRKEPLWLWLGRGGIAIGLAVIFAVQIISPVAAIKNNYNLWYEYIGSKPLDETLSIENPKEYVFEAENAVFSGSSSTGGTTDKGHACTVDSIKIGWEYSGCMLVKNLTTGIMAEKANTLTFTFQSDKDVRVNMICTVQGIGYACSMATGYHLTVNGSTPKGYQKVQVSQASGMTDVSVPIVLQKGENTIVFEAVTSQQNVAFAFDCIRIQTSANLSGFEKHYWDFSESVISVTPTAQETGVITLQDKHGSATYTLPSIARGYSDGLYDYRVEGDKVIYSCALVNMDVYTIEGVHSRTLTLEGGTFADGTTSKEVISNCPLPELNLQYGHIGWYDKDNGDIYEGTYPIMPDKDLTLVSVREPEKYVEKVDETVQQINMKSNASPSCIWGDRGLNGFSATTLKDKMDLAPITVFDSGYAANRYNYEGGVREGWSFMTLNTCELSPSQTAYLYVAFKNYGSETLNFTMYQPNASSSLGESNPHFTVNLLPGETVYRKLSFKYSNGNVLSQFCFNNSTSTDMSLAVAQFISYQPFSSDNEKYTLTLGEGVSFADGGKTVQLKEGELLPEVVYQSSVVDEVHTLGWIVDNGSTQTYAAAESFLMPDSDCTLTPCNTDQFNFSIAGGSALLDVWTAGKVVGVDPNSGGAYISNRFLNLTNVSATLSGVMSIVNGKAGTQMSINAQKDGYFRCMHAYYIDGERTITYTFKNMGAQTAKFHLYQINSGTAPSEYVKEVELAAGASTTFSITFSYNNRTLIWLMTFDEAYQGNLWYSAEIVKP